MFTDGEKNLHRERNLLKRGFMLLTLLALCLGAPRLAADVVTDWNAIAIDAATGQAPPQQQRTVAIMHAAIFDAVNAIDGRYTVYAVSPPVLLPASQEAAAAAAGHGVLVRLLPGQKAALDAQYAASLAQMPDGDAKQNGIAAGEFVAAGMVALRSSDGSAPAPYTLPPPGVGGRAADGRRGERARLRPAQHGPVGRPRRALRDQVPIQLLAARPGRPRERRHHPVRRPQPRHRARPDLDAARPDAATPRVPL